MTGKIKRFDVSEYLDDEQAIAEYLTAILEQDNQELLLAAIGDIVMCQVADKSHIGRRSPETGTTVP